MNTELCRQFFVAQLDEAGSLRSALDDIAKDAVIYVLNGLDYGDEDAFAAHRAIPVLNSLDQVEVWTAYAQRQKSPQPAIIHLDTGMSRLGLPGYEVEALVTAPERLSGLDIRFVMSHLACAEKQDHPMNTEQRTDFDASRGRLPTAPASLANSSGIFLGNAYHYDMARPGAALFGVAPVANESNPMRQVIRLQGKILQVHNIDRGRTVGYGATHRLTRHSRIATVAVGYGDGFLRFLGNRGSGYLGEAHVPVVGRVSMDLITFDVTDVREDECRPGVMVDLICEQHTVDDVAREAGTIGYEILTGLGRRYFRHYKGMI